MRVIFHIGQQKTGSTSLQKYLHKAYNSLKENGILYPKTLGNEKQNALLDDSQALSQINSVISKEFERELSTKKWEAVILSEENLFNTRKEVKENIKIFLDRYFNQIDIVVYLRRQEEHLLSLYQQNVRGKITLSLQEYVEKKMAQKYYEYPIVLRKWRAVFPNARMIIRPYGCLYETDVIKDFEQVIGYKFLDANLVTKAKSSNKSFDAESIELLRVLNGLEVSDSQKKKIRSYLEQKERKGKFNFSQQQQLEIWKAYKKSNKQLIKQYELSDIESEYFLKKPIEKEKLVNDDITKSDLVKLLIDMELFFENQSISKSIKSKIIHKIG